MINQSYLFSYTNRRFTNRLTAEKKDSLDAVDMITDIILAHSSLDHYLLKKIFWHASKYETNAYNKLDELALKHNKKVAISNNSQNYMNEKELCSWKHTFLNKIRNKCSAFNQYEPPHPAKKEYFSWDFWVTLANYVYFDFTGYTKKQIEKALGLKYENKYNLMIELSTEQYSKETRKVFQKLGEIRNQIGHLDIDTKYSPNEYLKLRLHNLESITQKEYCELENYIKPLHEEYMYLFYKKEISYEQ